MPGDILLYENHHGATNITLGKSVKEQWDPRENSVEPVKPAEVEPPYVRAWGSVYVRKGPSKAYGCMGVLGAGDRAHFFGFACPDNGWLLVEFGGATGWVSNKYAKVIE